MRQVIIYGDELYHHGVQGQKWGVRRYQNPDGSLTEEGRRRLGYGDNKGRREINKEARQNLKYANKNVKQSVNQRYGRVGKYFNQEAVDTWNEGINRNQAAYYRTRAATARTKYGRKLQSSRSFNSEAFADYYKKASNYSDSMQMLRRYKLDPNLYKIPVQRISGRKTTIGREVLDIMLTAGYGGIALDALYEVTGKDYASAVANKVSKKTSEATDKINKSLGV